MNKQGPGKIDWCDWSWNPVTGCRGGCPWCYVARMRLRFQPGKTREQVMEPAFHKDRLVEPLRLKRPARIFVVSAGDLWGDWVPAEWIEAVLEWIKPLRQHRFLFLTKNPSRYRFFEALENCWYGASVTGSKDSSRILQLIVSAPRERSFISFEPFLGDFSTNALWARWWIVGGLTGPRGRPANVEGTREAIMWSRIEDIPLFIKENARFPEAIQQFPDDLKHKIKEPQHG